MNDEERIQTDRSASPCDFILHSIHRLAYIMFRIPIQ
jgi:hypothetical protein